MTREEAVYQINQLAVLSTDKEIPKITEALNMAIEALQEPKTIIGIDAPYGSDRGIATIFKGKDDKLILEDIKEIMSVVRCKDCRYWQEQEEGIVECSVCTRIHDMVFEMGADGFCSYGERRQQ